MFFKSRIDHKNIQIIRSVSLRSQMFIIIIPITQQPVHDRLAENQPTAGLSSLSEYESGMGKSETELLV